MNYTSVDIHGSCVLRDTFEFYEPLKKLCTVNKFIQNNPIIAINQHSLNEISCIQIKPEDFAATAPVWYRWFNIQASANIFQYLSESPANYLLISIVECLYPYYQFNSGDKECKISNSYALVKNKIPEKYGFPGLSDPLILEPAVIEEYIRKYAEQIIKYYKEEDIILIRYDLAEYYIQSSDKTHKIMYFPNLDKYPAYKQFLAMISEMLIRYLPRIKAVDLPEKLEGDPNHRWGLSPQHYVPSVYQYLGRHLLKLINPEWF